MVVVKKLIAVVASLALMSSLMLVGCGGSPSSSSSSSSSSGSSGSSSSSSSSSSSTDSNTTNEMKLVKSGTLTVGSDCDYPPFILLEGDKPAGFEYDLLEAVANDMGLTLEFLDPQSFEMLPTMVAAGNKMDIAVSSMTINEERKAVVDFCDPYFDSNQACVVNASSSYTKTADLEGKTVGAQAGTTGMDWANEHIAGITMKPFNQASEGFQALQAGQIEAMFLDAPIAEYQTATNFKEMKMIEVIPTGEQYGFAVNKENTALKEAINTSLKNIIADGTYEKIFKEYFPNLTPSIS